MKYASLLALPAVALTLLASCSSDDSDYGTPGKTYLNLGGIEKSYTIESFSDQKLTITPTITSSFSDEDLEYLWTYYLSSKATASYYDPSTNTTTYPSADTLSHDRNLDMSVGLPDGQYTLIYTVKSKSTGYSQQVVTTLSTASALADGYYVLKEMVTAIRISTSTTQRRKRLSAISLPPIAVLPCRERRGAST